MNGAIGRVYALPEGVAGTEAVGGATHVDMTYAARDGLYYHCRVRGGHVDGDTFVPITRPVPYEQSIVIADSAAFEAWCLSDRGRETDPNGNLQWTESDIGVWALQQWLAEAQ